MKSLLSPTLLIALALPAAAQELVEKSSPHSVEETVERLTAAAEEAGATVFATVDHGTGAQTVDGDLGDMVLVIFGSPAIGTPIIEAEPLAGLDLPIRVLVYSQDNETRVAYDGAIALQERRTIDQANEALQALDQAVGRLTDAAIAP